MLKVLIILLKAIAISILLLFFAFCAFWEKVFKKEFLKKRQKNMLSLTVIVFFLGQFFYVKHKLNIKILIERRNYLIISRKERKYPTRNMVLTISWNAFTK